METKREQVNRRTKKSSSDLIFDTYTFAIKVTKNCFTESQSALFNLWMFMSKATCNQVIVTLKLEIKLN